MSEPALWRRLTAEYLGSALLAAVVIGSGIAAQRFSPGDVGLQLFENAAATGAGLFALILVFGPVSGGTSIRWCPSSTLPSVVCPGATPWRIYPPR
jgi:glycerol uptake facilitator-like aquaporin